MADYDTNGLLDKGRDFLLWGGAAAMIAIPSCLAGAKIQSCLADEDTQSGTYYQKQGRVIPEDLHYQPWRNWHAISGRNELRGVQCVIYNSDKGPGARCESGDYMTNVNAHGVKNYVNVNKTGGRKHWTRVRQKK